MQISCVFISNHIYCTVEDCVCHFRTQSKSYNYCYCPVDRKCIFSKSYVMLRTIKKPSISFLILSLLFNKMCLFFPCVKIVKEEEGCSWGSQGNESFFLLVSRGPQSCFQMFLMSERIGLKGWFTQK